LRLPHIFIPDTNIVESPLAALRLRTDAATRYTRGHRATAVIGTMLMVAQQTLRRLNAPELVTQIYLGVEYEDEIEITRNEVAARSHLHTY
jgi:hypothetical protein